MPHSIVGLLLFWVIASADFTAAVAQEIYSQKDRSEFADGLYLGCMDKQSSSALNPLIVPSVVSEACGCLAEKFTSEVFGSVEFQMAMHRKDKERLNIAIANKMSPEDVSKTFMTCVQASIAKHGGLSNVVVANSNVMLSKEIGLKGESRSSYITGGVMECKTTKKLIPENKTMNIKAVENFCNCIFNYSADRVSIADLAAIFKLEPAALKSQEKRLKESAAFCRQKND